MIFSEFGEPSQKDREVKPVAPDIKTPVYRSMEEDPAYQGDDISFNNFRDTIFGYTMAQEKNGKIIAIGGEGGAVPYLHVNDNVKLKGDSQALGGLDTAREAEIVEFAMPSENGQTDHIIRLKQGDTKVWVKPYQVEKV